MGLGEEEEEEEEERELEEPEAEELEPLDDPELEPELLLELELITSMCCAGVSGRYTAHFESLTSPGRLKNGDNRGGKTALASTTCCSRWKRCVVSGSFLALGLSRLLL